LRWRSARLVGGFDANVFVIHATLPPAVRERTRAGTGCAALARVKDGVSEQELRRAKNLVAAEFWRGASTIDGKARLLGEYAVMHGDYRLLFTAPQAYERVTREDVAAIARTCSTPTSRTVGVLLPTGGEDAALRSSTPSTASTDAGAFGSAVTAAACWVLPAAGATRPTRRSRAGQDPAAPALHAGRTRETDPDPAS